MVYHAINKSIAGFTIFNNHKEYMRMIATICYYRHERNGPKFCRFLEQNKICPDSLIEKILTMAKGEKIVDIIAYCIMPTHLHLLLEAPKKSAISAFTKNVLNSYTHYFNLKHKRKGPLWEGRTKKILVKTDEQLLHDTRYIHLNPVTAYSVNEPEQWPYSSYMEFIKQISPGRCICKYADLLEIDAQTYKEFVYEGISYQRELAEIKRKDPE